MSGTRPAGTRPGGPRRAPVALELTYDQAVALTRCIVRYLSLPEAPLLPPAEEGLVLEAYEALVDATVPAVIASGEDGWTPVP